MMRFAVLLTLSAAFAGPVAAQHEIGFIEKFALAADRDAVLKELVTGTEQYYFYHCLHYQNTGRGKELAAMLDQWAKRTPQSNLRTEILHRQAILGYETDPQKTLAYLQEKLGLQFNHAQQPKDARPDLPVKLDQKAIDEAVFLAQAFANNDNLSNISAGGLDWLMFHEPQKLSAARQKELLSKLTRPDYPGLVELLNAHLGQKESRGFGEFPVCKLLLPEQLAALAKLRPELLLRSAFVQTWLTKLAPNADVDPDRNRAEKKAWLERQWNFVKGLSPKFNSLKAHVLFQRLALERQMGNFPADVFLEYVKLPRPAPYVNPLWREKDAAAWQNVVDFNADWAAYTGCPPIGGDEFLVREYLLHLLEKAKDAAAYAPYVEERYLKAVFAEAKLLTGAGDAEQWFSWLTPGEVQALKDRVDVTFAPSNPVEFHPATDAISLDVKNVPKLLVRVFEINTENCYQAKAEQISTDLNLDGLSPTVEKTLDFAQPPLIRHRVTLKLGEAAGPDTIVVPGISKRGVWIVECVGNRKASRVLLRTGKLQVVTRPSLTGNAVVVFDEARQPVKSAYALLGGQRYTANEHGEIAIPFTSNPGEQTVIIGDGAGFASLESLDLKGEEYALMAGIHVPRETLIAGRNATVIIRPNFVVSGFPADPRMIEQVKLQLTFTSLDKNTTTAVVPDFKLEGGKEVSHVFRVPDRLANLHVELSGKVKSLITGQMVDVSQEDVFPVNTITTSDQIADVQLLKVGGFWFLQQHGRNGEPLADRAITVSLQRPQFSQTVSVSLKSDADGYTSLGVLDGVSEVAVVPTNALASKSWNLQRGDIAMLSTIHAKVGETIMIPWLDFADKKPDPLKISLLEMRNETPVADWIGAVEAGSSLVIKGLPVGDFRLLLPEEDREISISVTAGEPLGTFLTNDSRILESTPLSGINVLAAVDEAAGNLDIGVTAATKSTRVHVFASRFLPEFSSESLISSWFPEPRAGQPAWQPSLYLSGRDIGDEYRYVLERRFQKKFPGLMLPRPGLILNPWSINQTNTMEQLAEGGEMAQRLAEGKEAQMESPKPAAKFNPPQIPQTVVLAADLNFLAEAGAVKLNLTPDAKGMIALPLKELGDRQYVTIVATDGVSGVVRELALPKAAETKLRDTRLKLALDPKKHFTQQSQATILEKGASYVIDDALSAQFQVFDDLGGVMRYFLGLSKNETLGEFAFLIDWPKLAPEKQRELYSKYASHELSFFLSRKDPKFFDAVIKPYLANKKDKTFLDRYLLAEDLSDFLRPWNFDQLNIVERLLLAERIPAQRQSIRRSLQDLLTVVPVDRTAALQRFDDALFGNMADNGRIREEVEMLKEGMAAADPFAAAPENEPPEGFVPPVKLDARDGEPLAKLRGYSESKDRAEKMPAPTSGVAASELAFGAVAGNGTLRFKQQMQDTAGSVNGVMLADQGVLKAGDAVTPGLGGTSTRNVDYLALGDLNADGGVALRLKYSGTLYRKLDPPQEWAENNYWHLRITEQNAALITANRFWDDFAAWDGKAPFVSTHLGDAARSFAEMALALGVLDLPFAHGDAAVKTELKETKLTLTAPHRSLLLHREIKPAEVDAAAPKLLVSQNFFRNGDRYLEKDGEKSDKFVTQEFLTGVVYGAQVTVTNPTSSLLRLDLLFQIPHGAIPVSATRQTQNLPIDVKPFETFKTDFFFYFPAAGKFTHYPVHVAKNEKVVAAGEAFLFNVVGKPTVEDKQSWEYVSQYGSAADVFAFLDQAALPQLNLDLMAWRLRDGEFFQKAVALLDARHFYHATTYSYAVKHNATAPLREFLLHADDFLAQCGPALASKLLTIDPVARRTFEHLEYSPLVNARQHPLGRERTILNQPLWEQYQRFLNVLTHRAKPDTQDQLAATYYLLLQDRIDEGLAQFSGLVPADIHEKLQYDYLKAWLAMCQADAAAARQIAGVYANYPVDKWRERFAAVLAQLDELQGKGGGDAVDKEIQREKSQDAQAAAETALSLKVEAKTLTLQYANAKEAEVRYYPIDLEFLFSTSPFVSSDTGRIRVIRPGRSEKIVLPADGKTKELALPKELQNSNVVVEVTANGKSATQAYYANDLDVTVSENYGLLQVRHAGDKRPLGKVYVKVFADLNGQSQFYKDGYTDLRGKFDYASLNTGQLDGVKRFSILVLSEEFGAVVREVAPPRQ